MRLLKQKEPHALIEVAVNEVSVEKIWVLAKNKAQVFLSNTIFTTMTTI